MVTIHCLMQGIVIAWGPVTQTRYAFSDDNNHILQVDSRDAPDILSKIEVQGGCCGAPRVEKKIFELV